MPGRDSGGGAVTVDISQVLSLTAEAEEVLGSVGERMHAILVDAAEAEVEGHEYQNRTGFLEASTYAAELEESGDSASVQVGARMEYASFVEALGYQDLEAKIEDGDAAVATMFQADLERLASR